MAQPILVVEMPVPAERESEWNRWYHEVHISDVLANVPGAQSAVRYRLLGGDDDVRYLVIYQFGSEEALLAYFDSTAVGSRWVEYKQLWGADRAIRRRAFAPIFERRSEPR